MKKEVLSFLAKKCQEKADEFRYRMCGEIQNNGIESPIEQLFYIAWHDIDQDCIGIQGQYDLIPQYQIKEQNKILYRLDFVIFQVYDLTKAYMGGRDEFDNEGKNLKIAIELDSFTYHERDSKQFEYEKKRDRYLHLKKWKVFRFSGAEIMRNPSACVVEIFEHLSDLENEEIDRKYAESIKDKK
jgi:hypothetical protein